VCKYLTIKAGEWRVHGLDGARDRLPPPSHERPVEGVQHRVRGTVWG